MHWRGRPPRLEQDSRWHGTLEQLLARHARGAVLRDHPREDGSALAKMRALLRDRVEENIGFAALAQAAGLSAWHLNRVFRQRYGLPPHAYQMQLRLARARLWLQSPDAHR